MGCDIHMYVECKYKYTREGEWESGDVFLLRNPLGPLYKRKHVPIYGDRDYSLFAVLANVRNYDFDPYMEDPRGLPDDVTEYVQTEYNVWGIDAHSCSYFTLRELIDYDEECDHDILQPLIDRLKRRADELNLVWDFEWNSINGREGAREKAANIRIIFWFDN